MFQPVADTAILIAAVLYLRAVGRSPTMSGMRTPATELPINDPSLPRLSAKNLRISAARSRMLVSIIRAERSGDRHAPRARGWSIPLGMTRRHAVGLAGTNRPFDDQRDVTTVLVLLLGSFVVLVLGWVGGVVRLRNGPRWNTRQKCMGTLIWPIVALAFLVIHSAVVRPLGLVIALAGLVAEFILLLHAAARQQP
jgi:hypothetical protein